MKSNVVIAPYFKGSHVWVREVYGKRLSVQIRIAWKAYFSLDLRSVSFECDSSVTRPKSRARFFKSSKDSRAALWVAASMTPSCLSAATSFAPMPCHPGRISATPQEEVRKSTVAAKRTSRSWDGSCLEISALCSEYVFSSTSQSFFIFENSDAVTDADLTSSRISWEEYGSTDAEGFSVFVRTRRKTSMRSCWNDTFLMRTKASCPKGSISSLPEFFPSGSCAAERSRYHVRFPSLVFDSEKPASR